MGGRRWHKWWSCCLSCRMMCQYKDMWKSCVGRSQKTREKNSLGFSIERVCQVGVGVIPSVGTAAGIKEYDQGWIWLEMNPSQASYAKSHVPEGTHRGLTHCRCCVHRTPSQAGSKRSSEWHDWLCVTHPVRVDCLSVDSEDQLTPPSVSWEPP